MDRTLPTTTFLISASSRSQVSTFGAGDGHGLDEFAYRDDVRQVYEFLVQPFSV